MARRDRSNASTATAVDSTQEVVNQSEEDTVTSTATETPVETDASTEAVEATAEAVEAEVAESPAKAETPIDLTGFQASITEAIEARDEATGVVADGNLSKITSEYRALDGIKPKNAAKKLVNDSMRDAMDEMNIQLARAYMLISDALTPGATGGGSTTPKAPADPTEAFNLRLGTLYLAAELVAANKPSEVGEDQGEKLDALLEENREQATEYFAWVNREPVAEGAEDAPEPDASALVKAAVKAAQGKAVGSRVASGGTREPYTGVRRDIGKHISEAFAEVESGAFLTVAQIRKFESSEYGNTPPSAGAISSRLFPNSGKCTIEGIVPGQNAEGNRGASKA